MIEFTLEELLEIEFFIASSSGISKNTQDILKKIQLMIKDLIPEKHKSHCECGDKYHPNGAICIDLSGVVITYE